MLLFVTTPERKRTLISEFSFRTELRWTQINGWELWLYAYKYDKEELVAGEFKKGGIKIEFEDKIIVDTLELN